MKSLKQLKPADYFKGPVDYTPTERKMSEKNVEKTAIRWARGHGWFSRKYSSPSRKGVQDRIFVKDGRVVFIEYKKVGNEPTDLQCDDALDLMDHGGEVWWTNTPIGTKWILEGENGKF